MDRRFSRDVQSRGLVVSTGRDYYVAAGSFMYMDPPDHTRLRRLVQPFFTPRYLQQFQQLVDRAADMCFQRLAEAGQPADLVGQLAYPFTMRVTCDLLGIKEVNVDLFRSWAEVIPSLTRCSAEEIERSLKEMDRYLTDQLDAKRTEPRDDMLTTLVAAHDAGELTTTQTLNLARLMFFAGQDSPTNLIVRGMKVFMRHPGQWEKLIADDRLINNAVEEILRYSMISGTGLTHIAVATEDLTLAGVRIRAGESVVTPLIAANRDPQKFTDPDTFDITRSDASSHLAFGHGIHYCLGAPLARLQLRAAFRHLVQGFRGIHEVQTAEPTWTADMMTNRMTELRVAW
jgi:cytochrome P450